MSFGPKFCRNVFTPEVFLKAASELPTFTFHLRFQQNFKRFTNIFISVKGWKCKLSLLKEAQPSSFSVSEGLMGLIVNGGGGSSMTLPPALYLPFLQRPGGGGGLCQCCTTDHPPVSFSPCCPRVIGPTARVLGGPWPEAANLPAPVLW